MSKHFYTNGIKTIKVEDGCEVPIGFHLGRTFNANPWNKGLTKQNNEKLQSLSIKVSQSLKGNVPWNKGLTKETNESLKIVSNKVSISRKINKKEAWNKGKKMSFESRQKLSNSCKGKQAWNKGLTKDTNESILRTSEKLKNHKDFVIDWNKAKEKEIETKRRNNSFNTSKPEKELYQKLCIKYGKEDIITQYKSEKYLFPCDFYIKSQDLYIEYNGTIEHNKHPFDSTNIEDIKELEIFIQKAKEKGEKSRYWNIINVWTKRDPLKLKTFRENKLNFQIIYKDLIVTE